MTITKPNEHRHTLRAAAAAMLAGLSLMLTGCFITPGAFASSLELDENNAFTFSYEGEIFFLGLSNPAETGENADEFEPEPCYNNGTFDERECTRDEIESQRAQWEAQAEARAAEAAKKAEQMSVLLGGIDASDPEATAQFAQLLLRQKGWNRVEYKGGGVFDVSYSLTSTLTHDFAFPVIEGVPSTNPFVQIFLRNGNEVRINAPGFSAESEDNPLAAMMSGLTGMAGMSSATREEEADSGRDAPPEFPTIAGTFVITTTSTMAIRANNTDEGPSDTERGERLAWNIDAGTTAAPTALINLSE